MRSRIDQKTRRVWVLLKLAFKKFLRMDGIYWAGAFAFNAFFSLLPLIVLFVTIASTFIDQDPAGKEVIAFIERYVPISAKSQSFIFETIAGVIKARRQVGAVVFLLLLWTVLQSFITLIFATNRAWDTKMGRWSRLPLKSLMLLGITTGAVLLGIAALALMRVAGSWLLPVNNFRSSIYALGSFVIPLLVVFLSLSLFYKLAPRRPTLFSEVWSAALCTTALLWATESLFEIYLRNFATLNAVYGAFGGIMALLLWIYISGGIVIFGACLCAAQSEQCAAPEKT